MKWVLNIMLNRSYGANAPAFFIKNKIPEVDEAMGIYENFISNEELKSIAETREIKYKLDCNEYYFEGQTQKAIELAVKLIRDGKMSFEEAIIFCGLDENHEEQIKKLLNQ